MNFEEHKAECRQKLGNDFQAVHRWLDEYFSDPVYKSRHRRKRHHWQGIHEVEQLFGKEAGKAALLHILSDLRDESKTVTESDIPKDEADYVQRGYW